ncbi:MAG: glycosyltransferase [Methylococcales bacterium]
MIRKNASGHANGSIGLPSASRHIAIFIPTLEVGGAERVSVILANGFAERGNRVTLLTVQSSGPFRSQVDAGVDIVALGGSGVLTALPALIRWLRQSRPDAMLSMMSHTNLIAIVARIISRTPFRLVISERISLAHVVPGLKLRLVRSLMRKLYGKADHITTVSKAMADEISAFTKVDASKISAIYNPVIDKNFIRQMDEIDHNLHPWFSDPDRTIILAVGRLDPQKGFDTLLGAFAIVAEKNRSASLILLGEGGHRADLENLIGELGLEDRVALPGFSSNPFPSMKMARVFVLSSLTEGLPGVLVQAMACGAFVISTDCPTGPREILEDGKWGALVPVQDAGALANEIVASLGEVKGRNARLRASFFDEKSALDQYLNVLL